MDLFSQWCVARLHINTLIIRKALWLPIRCIYDIIFQDIFHLQGLCQIIESKQCAIITFSNIFNLLNMILCIASGCSVILHSNVTSKDSLLAFNRLSFGVNVLCSHFMLWAAGHRAHSCWDQVRAHLHRGVQGCSLGNHAHPLSPYSTTSTFLQAPGSTSRSWPRTRLLLSCC